MAFEEHAEYVTLIGKQTERIVAEKIELRKVLAEAGFAIPEGKRLSEWVEYIRPNKEEP